MTNEFKQIIDDSISGFDEPILYSNFKPSKSKPYETVKEWDDEKKIDFVIYCVLKQCVIMYDPEFRYDMDKRTRFHILEAYSKTIIKRKLNISLDSLNKVITLFSEEDYKLYPIDWIPVSPFLTKIKNQYKNYDVSPEVLTELLNKFKTHFEQTKNHSKKAKGKFIDIIGDIIFNVSGIEKTIRPSLFEGNDDFVPYANHIIEALPDEEKTIWYQLIEKAKNVSGSKPSKKFLTDTHALIKVLGTDKFKKMVNDWFAFLKKLKNSQRPHHYYNYPTTTYLDHVNTNTMKGIVWMCSHFSDVTTLNNIAALCERCFQKIPGIGPTSTALGNACLFSLYRSKGLHGIGHLSRLKLKIKRNSTKKLITDYLTESAAEKNVSLNEIEDMAVGDFGLENGEKIVKFDDYKCQLKITGVGKSTLQWYKPDGNTQKSVPSFVKTKYADKLKKIKATKKQLEKTITAQRDRIDRMFRTNRTWNVEDLKKYYLEHGLMSFLAEKIIWTFAENGKSQSAILHNDQWVNADNEVVEWSKKSTISLWHPATHTIEEVQKWRAFLIEHEIQQPLKQAFREVYFLTEAEINTRTYSNRMAAHIIKQHQFNTLAKLRGWSYSSISSYDDSTYNEAAQIKLPEYNLQAEYWVNEIGPDSPCSHGGLWNYVATDQVRFVNTENAELVELVNVPVIPFSEVLRDVDLFVGVASVGNDAEWQDSGDLPAHTDYWRSYSFGDLSEIAKNRKEILEGLIPRLKIRDVAEIKDKYLVVKGKLRTYKIHIGSTNIMMEPNDQYLCIVPDLSKKNVLKNVFIPFEGDKGLSIILSKAFLLADDDKITDSTITSQINRK